MGRTYFITSTINGWLKILHRPEFMRVVLGSLEFMIEERRIKLRGYVIMPNHLHLILSISKEYSLSSFLRDFHKFTSQQMLKMLRNEESGLLAKLKVNRNDQGYKVWMETHAVKTIVTYEFFRQKLEYMHSNPLSAKWRLSDRPELYPYSSAVDYIDGKPGLLKVEIMTPWTECE